MCVYLYEHGILTVKVTTFYMSLNMLKSFHHDLQPSVKREGNSVGQSAYLVALDTRRSYIHV